VRSILLSALMRVDNNSKILRADGSALVIIISAAVCLVCYLFDVSKTETVR
jgi:hypothetical protein